MSVFGVKMLVTNSGTTSVVFPEASIPARGYRQAFLGGQREVHSICQPSHRKPTTPEQMYAIELKEELSPLIKPLPQAAQTSKAGSAAVGAGEATKPPVGAPTGPKSGKNGLIGKLAFNTFYDLSVEVVKIFPGQYGDLELYVTDYTSNSALFDHPSPDEKDEGVGYDGDAFGIMPMPKREWPGPWGQMTLKIEVKEPHASFIKQNAAEGSLLSLSNVRTKNSRLNKLEANLWPDSRYPDKILARVVSAQNAPIQHLLERKIQYWESIKRKEEPNGTDGPEDLDDQSAPKKSKNAQKKLRQKANKRQKAEQGIGVASEREPDSDNPSTVGNKHGALCATSRTISILTDPTVRCVHEDVKQSTLSEILETDREYKFPSGTTKTLPFINQNRRALVRVIDFAPRTLEEFASPAGGLSQSSSSSSSWNWDFFLLVEDARPSPTVADQQQPQMWLHVQHRAAEYLLRLKACDLTRNNNALAQLREKFAILWGNLEERKLGCQKANLPYPPPPSTKGKGKEKETAQMGQRDDELSNLPFTCCIQEWGHPVDKKDLEEYPSGFIRIYRLAGTTIS